MLLGYYGSKPLNILSAASSQWIY